MRTLTVAEMALREIVRRRSVLVLLLVIPLAFYMARRGTEWWQGIRFMVMGVGWALSTAALFAGNGARSLEPRLRLSGYATRHLWIGRLLALWTVGAVVSVPYWVLVTVDLPQVRSGALAVILALTVLISAPFGLAISALLPRELEGMLVLLTVLAMQTVLAPEARFGQVLPFWFAREIGVYAIESDAGVEHLTKGLTHAAVAATVLLVAVAVLSGLRLRRRRHLRLWTA
jgi:hypothetical protein